MGVVKENISNFEWFPIRGGGGEWGVLQWMTAWSMKTFPHFAYTSCPPVKLKSNLRREFVMCEIRKEEDVWGVVGVNEGCLPRKGWLTARSMKTFYPSFPLCLHLSHTCLSHSHSSNEILILIPFCFSTFKFQNFPFFAHLPHLSKSFTLLKSNLHLSSLGCCQRTNIKFWTSYKEGEGRPT